MIDMCNLAYYFIFIFRISDCYLISGHLYGLVIIMLLCDNMTSSVNEF